MIRMNESNEGSMSYLMIIRGPEGIGKTTISKNYAKSLQGYHIQVDKIIDQHDVDYVPDKIVSSEKKALAANKIIIPIAKEKLDAGQIVIFDGTFYYESQIKDLITQLKFPHFVSTLKADLATCIARNKQRPNPLDEQIIKQSFDLASKVDYGDVIDTNNQTIDETMSEINTNWFEIASLKYWPAKNKP